MVEIILGVLPWQQVVAFLINTILVMFIVQLLKRYKEQIEPYIPMIAPIVSIALPALATFLTGLLGYPIDFSPILAFFSGFVAVGVHQLYHQQVKLRKVL